MPTIREMILKHQNKLANAGDLSPDDASKILVELTALMGNVNSALLDAQMLFNEKKMNILDEVKAVARAQIRAETTQEYRYYQEVKGYRELLMEMTRGLKYYLRANEEEYQVNKGRY